MPLVSQQKINAVNWDANSQKLKSIDGGSELPLNSLVTLKFRTGENNVFLYFTDRAKRGDHRACLLQTILNAGTSGFKRSNADFGDIFATSPLQKASSVVGAGVALKEVVQEFSQGNIEFSANSLDLAITGDGFSRLRLRTARTCIHEIWFMLNEQTR